MNEEAVASVGPQHQKKPLEYYYYYYYTSNARKIWKILQLSFLRTISFMESHEILMKENDIDLY